MNIALWKQEYNGDELHESRVGKIHKKTRELNDVVAEYGSLIEQVAKERAELLLNISRMELRNAELSVSTALYAELEDELSHLREVSDKARMLAQDNIALKRSNTLLSDEIDALKRECANLRGQITKLKNKGGVQ